MNLKVFTIFAELSKINFDHADRNDVQQVFMERLEIVALEAGLKPVFAAGQSAYNAGFNRQLEKFSAANGFRTIQTGPTCVQTQLLALPTHSIPSVLLETVATEVRQSSANSKDKVIWLFKNPDMEGQILRCVEGGARMGDIFGYPTCCTDDYLTFEAKRIEKEIDFFRSRCSAQTDSDILSLYRQNTEIKGIHLEQITELCDAITARQAASIKQFPFVHFIACQSCLTTPASPAEGLNKKMTELALTLSKTFARKFTKYAADYYKTYQQAYS